MYRLLMNTLRQFLKLSKLPKNRALEIPNPLASKAYRNRPVTARVAAHDVNANSELHYFLPKKENAPVDL